MEEISKLIKTIEDYEPVFIREKENLGMEEAVANMREEIHFKIATTLPDINIKELQKNIEEVNKSKIVRIATELDSIRYHLVVGFYIKYGEDEISYLFAEPLDDE